MLNFHLYPVVRALAACSPNAYDVRVQDPEAGLAVQGKPSRRDLAEGGLQSPLRLAPARFGAILRVALPERVPCVQALLREGEEGA